MTSNPSLKSVIDWTEFARPATAITGLSRYWLQSSRALTEKSQTKVEFTARIAELQFEAARPYHQGMLAPAMAIGSRRSPSRDWLPEAGLGPTRNDGAAPTRK
jgi:hypothetical protein